VSADVSRPAFAVAACDDLRRIDPATGASFGQTGVRSQHGFTLGGNSMTFGSDGTLYIPGVCILDPTTFAVGLGCISASDPLTGEGTILGNGAAATFIRSWTVGGLNQANDASLPVVSIPLPGPDACATRHHRGPGAGPRARAYKMKKSARRGRRHDNKNGGPTHAQQAFPDRDRARPGGDRPRRPDHHRQRPRVERAGADRP
jgi:hypothetical protein